MIHNNYVDKEKIKYGIQGFDPLTRVKMNWGISGGTSLSSSDYRWLLQHFGGLGSDEQRHSAVHIFHHLRLPENGDPPNVMLDHYPPV